MDRLKITELDDSKYELELIYNHIIFTTIIENFRSNLISFDLLEKILIGSLSSDIFILDILECVAVCIHDVIDEVLTIKLHLNINTQHIKKIKEEIIFVLNKKKDASIKDNIDLSLSEFEHKLNRKLIRKNSKNMYLSFLPYGFMLDDKFLIRVQNLTFDVLYNDKHTFNYSNSNVLTNNSVNKIDIDNEIYEYLKLDFYEKFHSGDEINKQKIKYLIENFNDKMVNNILKYIFDKYFVNFISFKQVIEVEYYHSSFNPPQQKISVVNTCVKSGNISNINYEFIINIQLNKKPIPRKIFFTPDIKFFNFDVTKTYSVLDESKFGHCLIEEI